MPSIKDLKKRITSVKNTQQTTKAMKMVSAAKLRRAQEAIYYQKPYATHMNQLFKQLMLSLPAGNVPEAIRPYFLNEIGTNPTIEKSAEAVVEKITKKVLLVVVTSDRGLCGGFNSGVIKLASKILGENPNWDTSLAFLGKKGFDFFKIRPVKIFKYFSEQGGKVTFQKASQVAGQLMDSFIAGEFEEIYFIFNEFKNAATQKPMLERFLPVGSVASQDSAENVSLAYPPITAPSSVAILEALFSKVFKGSVYKVMLESQAGEHGARMAAMENATKNAGDMIRKLTLVYNKQRQAAITKELLEIISGSESQKQA